MFINNSPLVTTFTLCYHTKARLVISAIDSIHKQTYKNFEHIIINDAPEDKIEWPKIKKHIIDKGYKSIIIEHLKNQGISKNLNEIISISKGEYIGGCSDDLWEKSYLKKQIDFFQKQNKDVAVIFSNLTIIDEFDLRTGEISFKNQIDLLKTNANEQFLQLLKENYIFAPSALCSIKVISDIGSYSNDIYAEDYQIWFKLLLNNYKIAFNNIREVNYRIRQGALSNTYESSGKMAVDRCRLFHQTKSLTTTEQWEEVKPIYYKFIKKIIRHSDIDHKLKMELTSYGMKDLNYLNIYLLGLIVFLKLYKLKLIEDRIG